MPKTSSELVKESKRYQRLTDRKRALKRKLADVEQDLKLSRKIIRGLSNPIDCPVGGYEDLDGQLPPKMKGRVE